MQKKLANPKISQKKLISINKHWQRPPINIIEKLLIEREFLRY